MGITVRTTPKSRISINNGGTKKLIVNTGGGTSPSGAIDSVIQLKDVDASDADNNETLVYDDTVGKFIVREIPIINGGTF